MLPSRPRKKLPGDERLGLPLGAWAAVGRWVRGGQRSPPQMLPIRDSFLIAPDYKDKEKDLDSSLERSMLETYFGGHKLEPASRDWLDEYLVDHTASLLHFACHGAIKGQDSVIYLEGWDQFSSGELEVSDGFQAAFEAGFPVVFLNACDAAASSLTLGPGGRGFPEAFRSLGACALIAPLWPVTKHNAPRAAEEIYRTAVGNPGRAVADVLAELRTRSYTQKPFDDTWAAYCLFGDPTAPLRRAVPVTP